LKYLAINGKEAAVLCFAVHFIEKKEESADPLVREGERNTSASSALADAKLKGGPLILSDQQKDA